MAWEVRRQLATVGYFFHVNLKSISAFHYQLLDLILNECSCQIIILDNTIIVFEMMQSLLFVCLKEI